MMGEPATEIRLLAAADASAYWDLRLEALECEPHAFSASAEEHRNLTLEDIQRRLSSDPVNNFVVGAFADQRLVGTAGFFRNPGLKERHKGRVWGVYVTPTARARGTGREMLRVLLQRAIAIEGIEQISLSVSTTQHAAVSLYRSLGFASFGCEPRALKVGGRYVDEENMVLHVNVLYVNRPGIP